jgi:RNA polymerase sigma factor (sigma-70 family)
MQKFTFEEIVKQNENRIHYQLQLLGIRDMEGDFYAEALIAMWRAYKKYDPNKGPMATYFNYSIRNRMIDLIRARVREEENNQSVVDYYSSFHESLQSTSKPTLNITSDKDIVDEHLWHKVFSTLTDKQRKWVYYAIIKNYSLKEIAEKEGVSVEAVKSWAKEAKKKLRRLWADKREFEEEVSLGDE